MLTDSQLFARLADPLDGVDLPFLGPRRRGKVRDLYQVTPEQLALITTDRLSAFDRILGLVPYKGQVLNQLAAFWFEQTAAIVPNHLLETPDPNVTIARACRRSDYDVMLVTADEGTDGIVRVASTALCDAVLVGEIESSERRIAALSQIPIPAVMIGVPDEHEGLTCVDFDFEEAGRRCTSLLADAGHRRIGVVCETNPTILAANYTHRFARGVEESVAERNLELVWIPAEAGAFEADSAVKQAIAADALGMIAMPPYPLSDLLQAMVANGIQPGVDASAIGFTEKADLDSAPVAPTYLSMNREDAASLIVKLALAAVERTATAPHAVHLIPPTFVAGESLIGARHDASEPQAAVH